MMKKVHAHATLSVRLPAVQPPAAHAVQGSHRAAPAACTQRDDRDRQSAQALRAGKGGPTAEDHGAAARPRAGAGAAGGGRAECVRHVRAQRARPRQLARVLRSRGGVPMGSAHLEEEGLDEAADDEAVDLEAAEPPVADRGSCPHSDHPRGITSEVVQLARGSNPSQPRISGPHGRMGSRQPMPLEAAARPMMMPATGASARVCEKGGWGVFSLSKAASGQLGGSRQAAQKQCAQVRQMQGNSWRRAHGRQGGNGGRTCSRGSCRACPN